MPPTKKYDITTLIIGAIVFSFSFVGGLALACPTLNQQQHLHIAAALGAAGMASTVPGFVSVAIKIPTGGIIRAGGALAVFFIVFWFNPASWADDKLDRSFSNASCQGATPVGLHIPRKSLPDYLDPEKVGTIDPEAALGRPVRFSFDYTFQPFSGSRHWSQVRPGVWVEMYPDPTIVTVFSELGRDIVDGCKGVVVAPKVHPKEIKNIPDRLFIPDKGCKHMWLKFQYGHQPWDWVAAMKDIS